MPYFDFQATGISALMKDYLQQKSSLQPLYFRFPEIDNYSEQAREKLETYPHRIMLNRVMKRQHARLELTEKQAHHLELLQQKNTVTVTTGHQLNLMTGPLYFIYKILHTVKICDALNAENNAFNYVPVFWMATEDHDFEEINHFYTYDKRYAYQASDGGFAGHINSEHTEDVMNEFMEQLGDNIFSAELKRIIKAAYFQKLSLAEATRILVHELLGHTGILIFDADDAELKKCMQPYFEKELFASPSQKLVEQTNEVLKAYKNQAYAREINLFYLHNNRRERIEKSQTGFVLVDSLKEFTESEMQTELKVHPERFSPNVILRPLYQEVILPNVAYTGGGGEISYWLQLKTVFQQFDVLFPMLVLRNSGLIVPAAVKHKAVKTALLSEKMFKPLHEIKKEIILGKSELFEPMEALQKQLEIQFDSLKHLAAQTSTVFGQMVEVQQTKQVKGFDKMRERLLKAEQMRMNKFVSKTDEVYEWFFPEGNWQERQINFSQFYAAMGKELFDLIYNELPPFESRFVLLYPDY